MRALNDPNHIYRQYEEWDYWLLSSAHGITPEQWQAVNSSQMPPGYVLLYAEVDSYGSLEPLLTSWERRVHAQYAADASAADECKLSFMVYGQMPRQLKARMDAAKLALEAPLIPRVPQWLAANPPAWATVLPNGEVLTLGPLGGQVACRPVDAIYYKGWMPFPSGAEYYRYSAEGQLIATSAPGQNWWELFLSGYRDALSAAGAGSNSFEYLGYIVVTSGQTGQWQAIYDYDGTLMPKGTDPAQRAKPLFPGWSAAQLPLAYKAQNP